MSQSTKCGTASERRDGTQNLFFSGLALFGNFPRNSHLLGAHPMIIILFECDLSRNKSSPSSLISLHNMYVLYMYMYVCTSCVS